MLYSGTRGPGKSDALLMDFLRHVGEGWGREWRGILFRSQHKDLNDIIERSRETGALDEAALAELPAELADQIRAAFKDRRDRKAD